MRVAWVALAAVAGCGRIGYDATGGATDAPTDATPGIAMACGAPTLLIELGATVPVTRMDVTATTTGFVVAWDQGAEVFASGLASYAGPAGPHLDNIQTGGHAGVSGTTMALAAIDDDAVLAVGRGGAIDLVPLNEHGYSRGSVTSIAGWTGSGAGFLVADPGRDRYLLLGNTTGAVQGFLLDRDGAQVAGPAPVFATTTEGATAVPTAAGYAAMTGAGQCDFVELDSTLAASSPHTISSTCHHAALTPAPITADKVVAAWNCDNDTMWANAGTMTGGFAASDTTVYVNSAPAPEGARLTTTAVGVWYAFQQDAALATALLDDDGALMPAVTPGVVHTAGALGGYDLAHHGDDAYLMWIDNAPGTALWAMRLCAPGA